jgi:16S rRNA (guanine527-N7)-methyltransferase
MNGEDGKNTAPVSAEAAGTPEEAERILKSGAKEAGVELDGTMAEKFRLYAQFMTEYNEKVNLTAITDPGQIALKHFVDCLFLLKYIKPGHGASVADVGSGAGFPGVVLKIAREDLNLTCIDSLNKRVIFLTELGKKLGLGGFGCCHLRAEEAGRRPELRGRFDLVTARAVASLPVLCELCLPLAKKGGIFCAMKGPQPQQEVKDAQRAIRMLGARLEGVHEYTLPGSDMGRSIIIIKKTGDTPNKYPRPTARISKEPL